MSTTLPITLNLRGRVDHMRLAPGNALNALFEAVVNSIHAILDGPEPKNGEISIQVLREKAIQQNIDGKPNLGDIIGFEVTDNGIGFNEDNFQSFRVSDSMAKAKYGGKGVGRLLWLKVFRDVSITSVYDDVSSSIRNKRQFTFSIDGVVTQDVHETEESRKTTVIIKNPIERYRQSLQHEMETLAARTIEHHLEYLIAEEELKVCLLDVDSSFRVELGKLFREDLRSEIKRETFPVNGVSLDITHLLVKGRKNARHSLHFCANSRQVKGEIIGNKISGLSGSIKQVGSDDNLAYQGYISGNLLDNLVDSDRTNFDFEGLFPPDTSEKEKVTYDSVLVEALRKAGEFLNPILQPIRDDNMSRIRMQIENNHPEYRHLLKHRETEVSAIPPGTEGNDLDVALYKIAQKFDIETRERLANELKRSIPPDEAPNKRRERVAELFMQINDSGVSKLANHVLYRRTIIEFLDDQLGLQSDGKYSLEQAVHMAVCPTKSSSDDLPPAQMNLWLLDDRFYYHYYLASDLPFKEMKETVSVDSPDRPDIAIFNRSMAFSDSLDQIGSVVLVEFKRPSRDDYSQTTPEKNPINQVLEYVITLKSGSGKGFRGQLIDINKDTPFYAYIVASLTPSLRKIALLSNCTPTPDGQGYFLFNDQLHCYVEIISFQKLIRDAKKRNQAFFDKLNIPLTQ